jgi:lysylphosphatidylglycerol synthetase-like protein (DUF2156 family)
MDRLKKKKLQGKKKRNHRKGNRRTAKFELQLHHHTPNDIFMPDQCKNDDEGGREI